MDLSIDEPKHDPYLVAAVLKMPVKSIRLICDLEPGAWVSDTMFRTLYQKCYGQSDIVQPSCPTCDTPFGSAK